MVSLQHRAIVELQQPGGSRLDRLLWYGVFIPAALGPLVRLNASFRNLTTSVTGSGRHIELLDSYPDGAPFTLPGTMFWASLVPVLWITGRIMTRPLTGSRVVYLPWLSWFLITAGAFSTITTALWFPGAPDWPRNIIVAGAIMALCGLLVFVRATVAFLRDLARGEVDWIEAMK